MSILMMGHRPYQNGLDEGAQLIFKCLPILRMNAAASMSAVSEGPPSLHQIERIESLLNLRDRIEIPVELYPLD